MMIIFYDKEVIYRGVILYFISIKGSEWVSEIEIECLMFKVLVVEWVFLI